MTTEEFNKVFVLPNKKEIQVKNTYEGQFLEYLISREYLDEKHAVKNISLEEWEDIDCRRVQKRRTLFNRDTFEEYQCIDTFVIAEDKGWVEYETTPCYDISCSNTQEYKKIEVVLQTEDYKRRLFLEWKGNIMLSSYFSYIADEIYEKIKNGGINNENYSEIEMYSDNGEYGHIEIESVSNIQNMIVSVRVIEFKSKVFDTFNEAMNTNYDFTINDDNRRDYIKIRRR